VKIRTLFITASTLVAAFAAAEGAELTRETLVAWDRYVAWTEHRMRTDDSFLLQETLLETTADGRSIAIPKGLVHHWLGSVFIPNTTVDELVGWLQDYDEHHRYFDEVESSKLVSRNGDDYAIFLRLRRKKVVTVHYNTEHLVRYRRHGDGRVSSASYSTRIAEIDNAGEADEIEKAQGDDRGFLWRLNSYWRFEQGSGGVTVELESLSLSRGVPVAVQWLVGRYLDSVPRESIEATLRPIQREAPRTLVTTEKASDVAQ
jgi:hypothetical protein